MNDREVDILKVNGIFRGAYTPAGNHRVSFRFDPVSLRRGWTSMVIGLILLAAMIAYSMIPAKQRVQTTERQGVDRGV